jgi:hypothetical protein
MVKGCACAAWTAFVLNRDSVSGCGGACINATVFGRIRPTGGSTDHNAKK